MCSCCLGMCHSKCFRTSYYFFLQIKKWFVKPAIHSLQHISGLREINQSPYFLECFYSVSVHPLNTHLYTQEWVVLSLKGLNNKWARHDEFKRVVLSFKGMNSEWARHDEFKRVVLSFKGMNSEWARHDELKKAVLSLKGLISEWARPDMFKRAVLSFKGRNSL